VKGSEFQPWLYEVAEIVGGEYTQGIGDEGADALEALAARLPLSVATRWMATFKSVSVGELPKASGVYVADVGVCAYVGVASNIFSRWWSTSDYMPGHLSAGSASRSSRIVDVWKSGDVEIADCEVLVRVHDVTDYGRLSVEECFTYAAMLRLSGELDVWEWERRVVNSPVNLGAVKRAESQAVVAFDVEDGVYFLASSQSEMARQLGVNVGGISLVVRGMESSRNGYTFRHASDAEVDVLGDEAFKRLVPDGDPVVEVTTTSSGKHRVVWSFGPMSSDGVDALRRARQKTDVPKSGVAGVVWDSCRLCWHARAWKVVNGRKVQVTVTTASSVADAVAALDAWVAEDPENRVRASRTMKPRSSWKKRETSSVSAS